MEKLENRNVLIDTNLIIQHLRIRDKSQSALSGLPSDARLHFSAVSWCELKAGGDRYQLELSVLVQELRILPFDAVAAEKAADIYLDLRQRGMLIEFRDIFIAATALVHSLPIKTLNTKDFERIEGLKLI